MTDIVGLHRAEVATPLGAVHLVGFVMDGPHRPVIFKILGEASGLDISAADLVQDDEHPRPAFPRLDFDVNWTHSKGICVVAYGEPGLCIGVDLEKHSPKHLRLADRFYHADEVEHLHGLASSADLQRAEFYRLWSRKEALYKCVGGTFFEGAIGRSVLGDSLMTGTAESPRQVHFVDLDGGAFTSCCAEKSVLKNEKAAGFPAALCVAVSLR